MTPPNKKKILIPQLLQISLSVIFFSVFGLHFFSVGLLHIHPVDSHIHELCSFQAIKIDLYFHFSLSWWKQEGQIKVSQVPPPPGKGAVY